MPEIVVNWKQYTFIEFVQELCPRKINKQAEIGLNEKLNEQERTDGKEMMELLNKWGNVWLTELMNAR
jgi:hypothetical protein